MVVWVWAGRDGGRGVEAGLASAPEGNGSIYLWWRFGLVDNVASWYFYRYVIVAHTLYRSGGSVLVSIGTAHEPRLLSVRLL